MTDHRPTDAERLEIRSYRTVFELERRIYRIDRLRLNPQGIPVRGVVYALVLIAAVAMVERLPAIGWVAAAFPWYVRYVGAPAALAALAATLRIDGRPFHLAAVAIGRLAAGRRQLSSLRPAPRPGRTWFPPDVVMLPDGSDPRVRRFRFTGPGAVVVAVGHQRHVRRRGAGMRLGRTDITLRVPAAAAPRGRAQVLELARGARLETRRERC